MVIFYVTAQCNLNCSYCEDFGARLNSQVEPHLALEKTKKVIAVIRSGTDNITFTGGEPLLYPKLGALIKYAKEDLNFHTITLQTNGYLLDQNETFLPHLDRLVVSLDSIDVVQPALKIPRHCR